MPKTKAAADQAMDSSSRDNPVDRADPPLPLPARWAWIADRMRLEWRVSWLPERYLVVRAAWLSRTVFATMTIMPVLDPAQGRIFERISVVARTVFPDDAAHHPAGRLDISFMPELDDVAALPQAEAELKTRYVTLLAERERRGEAWEHLIEGVALTAPEAEIAAYERGLDRALDLLERYS